MKKLLYIFLFLATTLVSAQNTTYINNANQSDSNARTIVSDSIKDAARLTIGTINIARLPSILITDTELASVIPTPAQIATNLEALTGENRISYTALKDKPIVYVDDYTTEIGNIVTNTAEVQAAFDAAQGGIVEFNKDKTYILGQLYTSLGGLHIKGNDCNLFFNEDSFSQARMSLIISFPRKNNTLTGLYTGIDQDGTVDNIKVQKQIIIEGFNYNANYTSVSLFQQFTQGFKYGYVEKGIAKNNHITNLSGSPAFGFNLIADDVQSDDSAILEGFDFIEDTAENLGHRLQLVVEGDFAVGATSVNIRNKDFKTSIDEKLKVGQYIIFSTAEKTATYLTNQPHLKSGSIYKITGLTAIDHNSSSITIQSGTYSGTNGFIADGTNLGLKAPLVTNLAIYPVHNFEAPALYKLPFFNGTSGQNTITRALSNTQEDGYANNLYVNQKIIFLSGGSNGVFTITNIAGNTITLDKNLQSSFTSIRADEMTRTAEFIHTYGNVGNIVVDGNSIKGGAELFRFSGYRNPKYKSFKKYPNTIKVTDNNIENVYFGIEGQGENADATPITQFTSLSYTKDATTVSIPNSSAYKLATVNGVSAITNTATVTATPYNSLMVGDILAFDLQKDSYIITAISTTSISVQHWDDIEETSSGGFVNTAVGNGSIYRFYNQFLGTSQGNGTIEVTGNTYKNPIARDAGAYFISSVQRSGKLYLNDNHIYLSGTTAYEVTSENLIIDNDKLYTKRWNGEDTFSPPSVNESEIYAIGYIGDFYGSEISYINNFVDFEKTGNYDRASGYIAFRPYKTLGSYKNVNFSNNTFKGTVRLFVATSPLTMYWDNFEFKNNTVITANANLGSSKPLVLLGKNNNISGNTFQYRGSDAYERVFEYATINPSFNETTTTTVSSNIFNLPTTWGTTVNDLGATITKEAVEAVAPSYNSLSDLPSDALAQVYSGTGRTLTLADANGLLNYGGLVDGTFTIPTNAAVPFEIGTVILIAKASSGNVIVNTDAGVSLNGTARTYKGTEVIKLWKTGVDGWQVLGTNEESFLVTGGTINNLVNIYDASGNGNGIRFNGRNISSYFNNALANLDINANSTYYNSDILLATGKTISSNGTTVPFAKAISVSGAISSTGKLTIGNVQEFADNAAALTGGLVVGDAYRTGDILKIVH